MCVCVCRCLLCIYDFRLFAYLSVQLLPCYSDINNNDEGISQAVTHTPACQCVCVYASMFCSVCVCVSACLLLLSAIDNGIKLLQWSATAIGLCIINFCLFTTFVFVSKNLLLFLAI